MKVAEFDKFAEEYLATHKANLAVTGLSRAGGPALRAASMDSARDEVWAAPMSV